MFSFLFVYELDSKEKRDSFFEELKNENLENICSSEDGCNKYKYLFADNDDTHIYIVESWRDRKSQKIHCTQPHCQKLQEIKKKYGVKSSMIEL